MSSLQDEFEDSRTSGVGRKRDLEDLTPCQDSRAVSSDQEDSPRSRKRAKKELEPSDDARSGDESMSNGHSPRKDNHLALDPREAFGHSEPNPPILTQSSQPTSWNKSVQTGLRTSFRSKVHATPQFQAPFPALQDDGAKTLASLTRARGISSQNGDVDTPIQVENIQDVSKANSGQSLEDTGIESEDALPESVEPVYGYDPREAAEDFSSDIDCQPTGSADRSNQSVRPGEFISELLEDLEDQPQSAAGSPKLNLPGRERYVEPDATQPRVRRKKPLLDGSAPIYPKETIPKERLQYTNKEGTFKLCQVLKGGKRISLQEITFQDFKPDFLASNSKTENQIKPKSLNGAFRAYVALFYGHAVPALRQPALDTILASVAAVTGLPTQKGQGKQKEPKLETAEVCKEVAEASKNAGKVTQKSVVPVVPILDDDYDAMQNSPTTDGDLTDAIDIEMTGMELALQQKYFPAVPGFPMVFRCLVCADSTHKTIDCPALSCAKCSGVHSTFTCPQNQRCGKCRQKGHAAIGCPEKLLASKSELDRCELCGFTDHLEVECHRIWRSFAPKTEEIRKVADIPNHCYLCGASGHYGAQCGLQRGKILSGGVTWSRANQQTFLESQSGNRVISAHRKSFHIKGKANDPINLDDDETDEEIAFIRPNVSANRNARTNGHIRIEQRSRVTQPPPYPRNDYKINSQTLPRRAAPNFGPQHRSQDESMRYGRERTLSPPPAFRDDSLEMQLRYRQENYHPLPPRPQEPQAFTFAAQPTAAIQLGNGNRKVRRGGGNIRTHRGSPAPVVNSGVAKKPRKRKKKAATLSGKSAD